MRWVETGSRIVAVSHWVSLEVLHFLDPVGDLRKFDSEGNAVESFGGGMLIWPHGIEVDPDGNVWMRDAVSAEATPTGNRGHQVIKFSLEVDRLTGIHTSIESPCGTRK